MSELTLSDIMSGSTLPGVESVGSSNDTQFTVPIVDSNVTNGELTKTFLGDFVGHASTYRPNHFRHTTEFMDPTTGLKCNRCRWFELRIFYNHSDSCYLLHFAGRSIVPGEVQRYRTEDPVTAYELIETLQAQTSHGANSNSGERLTAPALRALSQAAGFDKDIEKAYRSRRAQI
jgi:hypothetical protein